MKNIYTFVLLFLANSLFAQIDSTNLGYKTYPNDFQNSALRFKPFMMIQNTLGAEYEIYSKKRASSIVIGAEATVVQIDDIEIYGGAIELDKRIYLDRSIFDQDNSEAMFYISYGGKFGTYKTDYTYTDYSYSSYDYSYEEVTKSKQFNKVAINLKVGLEFLAFEKISIDTNIGGGIQYNNRNFPESEWVDNFTFDSITRKGIQPTIHIAIGLAN